jgi:hypothetical protein
MEVMNAPTTPLKHPPVASEAAWSAATERVERYLRAHHFTGARHVARLTADIIAIARARHRPGADPMTTAMETVDACMGAWFARLMGTGEPGDASLLARGRVALAMGGVPARWAEYFLRESAVPTELVRVMREADLGRRPDVRLGHMAPPPPAKSTVPAGWLRLQVSYRWPFVRVVTGLAMVISLIGTVWAAGL